MEIRKESKLTLYAHLLQLSQSVNKLHELLHNGLIIGYFKQGMSIVVEVILFMLFLFLLTASVFIPINPIQFTSSVTDGTSMTGIIQNDELALLMLSIKGSIFLASLMPLALMIVFRRNRRKRALIRLAFEEVKGMKNCLEKSINELAL